MDNNSVTITSGATLLVASNTSRKRLTIENTGTVTCYIAGNNSLTTSNAYPIAPGEVFKCNDYTGVWYGIVSSTSGTLKYTEET